MQHLIRASNIHWYHESLGLFASPSSAYDNFPSNSRYSWIAYRCTLLSVIFELLIQFSAWFSRNSLKKGIKRAFCIIFLTVILLKLSVASTFLRSCIALRQSELSFLPWQSMKLEKALTKFLGMFLVFLFRYRMPSLVFFFWKRHTFLDFFLSPLAYS